MTWYIQAKVTYERNHLHSLSHQILLGRLWVVFSWVVWCLEQVHHPWRIIGVAAIRISLPRLLSLFGASTLHPEASFRGLRHPSQLWQTPGSTISRQQHPLGPFGVWTSRLCYCISFKGWLLTDILPRGLRRATGGIGAFCHMVHHAE